MKLSVLDQAPVTHGNTAADALLKAEELAILADELGYVRMWMAEHHGTENYASSAPEITIAHLAAKTKNIRLGTGGTMMMHYSPLKMAEVFKTLSAFAPGRIDFGVGRARVETTRLCLRWLKGIVRSWTICMKSWTFLCNY